MPIVVREFKEDGRSLMGPVIACDVCAKEITGGRVGAYLWDMRMNEPHQEPTFACKGVCFDAVEQRMKEAGAFVGWHELYAFVGWLKGNVMRGSNPADKKAADEAERGGLNF